MAVDPIATFTREHPDSGRKQTRYAYTASEAVQLRADGWVEKTTSRPTSTTSTASAASDGGSKSSSK